MKLGYFASKGGNVGDDLNVILWPRIFGADFFSETDDTVFIGVGSVLDGRFGKYARRVVFGTGAPRKARAPQITAGDASWDLRFVRGPRTAQALGGARYISDPAIIVDDILGDEIGPAQGDDTRPLGFVRHFRTPAEHATTVASRFDLVEIDPTLDVVTFCQKLRGCRAVVCEAMHGAIFADALRVPWAGVRVFSHITAGPTNVFKWADWMESLQIAPAAMDRMSWVGYAPAAIRNRIGFSMDAALRRVERRITDQSFYLSDDTRLRRARDEILGECDRLKSDYG